MCLLMKRSLDHGSKSEKRWKQSNSDVDKGRSLNSVVWALGCTCAIQVK